LFFPRRYFIIVVWELPLHREKDLSQSELMVASLYLDLREALSLDLREALSLDLREALSRDLREA
jgi:hypothetical protein